MKTNYKSVVTKLAGLLFTSIFASMIATGCSSTQSGGFKEASGSSNASSVHHSRATVGNLVALKHDGKTIYVHESAVEAQLSHGDTLALNDDGKTIYGNERELREYLNQP